MIYQEAYYLLAGSRDMGWGVSGIKVSETLSLGRAMELGGEDLMTFVRLVHACDAEFLEHARRDE